MKAIMEPQGASTPGDTRLPRAQAVHVSLSLVVYLYLQSTGSLSTPPPLVRRTYLARASVSRRVLA